ncbi:hypothetical protein SEUCBS140593_003112 [Sporothrix eucalyptigena]|uniref:DUF7580 domain-containing protein n=1 Tax=Sporothrix eucalyptigena TaxID=1812306 RepID=A0ABP0BC64_9PEZI
MAMNATSLAFFYLFASPLFQRHTWDMDSIHIVHGDASIPTQEVEPPVYLSFCLDSQQSESTAARPHVLAEDGNPLLLALITIIMELEMERKIVLCDEDFDDRLNDLSLYYAVLRYHADLNDNIDCHFQEIVASCLDIYEKSQNMLGRQDYIEIQTNLFNKVIVPLMARYDMLRTAKQQAVVQVQGGNRAQIPADRQDLLNTEDLHKGFSRHLVTITEVDGMAHHPKVFPPNYATA